MITELSPKMKAAIDYIKRNGKMVRYPGGYWGSQNWSAWNGLCFGTSTIEAIVKRGYCFYSAWKDGKNGRFPIECILRERIQNDHSS